MKLLISLFVLFLFFQIFSYAQQSVRIENDTIFQTEFSFFIFFKTNKDQADSIPDWQFNRLRNALRVFPQGLIQLEARTDSRGSKEYNHNLANRRLDFTKEVLLEKEIPENRILDFVFGKTNPIADNESEEGRQKNRSVQVSFKLIKPLVPLKGRIICMESGEGLEGMVYVGAGKYQDSMKTNTNGDFDIKVPSIGEFSFEFHSSDHIKGRRNYELRLIDELLERLNLEPLREGMFFNFDDILFVGGTPIILDGYRHNLPRLYQMINAADSYRFEIQGHVHCPGRPQHSGPQCFGLSERRALKIYTYLVERGIEEDRLEWKAYSNLRMRYPNAVNENLAKKNRRVTVKVLGMVD
ncbi:MAG: hypothetical protein EA362_10770 [Saprospirales bacterium]|nr:MAG: hypothetical protein EA362_10770 [Saprospirales bacterium]